MKKLKNKINPMQKMLKWFAKKLHNSGLGESSRIVEEDDVEMPDMDWLDEEDSEEDENGDNFDDGIDSYELV